MDKVISTGKKAGVKWSDLKTDPEQLKEGIEDEKEHKDVIGDSNVKAAKIAMAHLKEMPAYYTSLNKMEKGADKVANKRKILKNLIKKV